MLIAEIEEVLSKYKTKEEKIEEDLKKATRIKTNEDQWAEKKTVLTLGEAQERNKTILKELETVKGNLRSKAIFSPAEMQWEKICEKYQKQPSLPVVTWHCHLPIFV